MRRLLFSILLVSACKSTPPTAPAAAPAPAAPCPACPEAPVAAACPPATECPKAAAAEPAKCPECPAVAAVAAVAAPEAGPPPGGKAAHLAMLDQLPDSVAAVLTVRLESFVNAIAAGEAGLFPQTTDKAAFRASLAAASRKEFGIDVFGAKTVTFWGSLEGPVGGLFLDGEFGGELNLAGLTKVDIEGKQLYELDKGLYLGQVGTRIIVGTPGAFAVKTDPAVTTNRALHKAALESVADGYVVATVTPDVLAPVFGPTPIGAYLAGIRGIALSLGSDLAVRLAVAGTAEALGRYEAMVDQVRAPILEAIRANRESIVGKFLGSEVAAVFLDAFTKDFEAFKWTQRPSPELLLGATPPVQVTNLAVMAIPVLSAVAVPAFIKYQRRAKTTEAIDQIDKLYKGSAMYFSSPRVEKATGNRLPCAFPPSTGPTPATTVSCCGGEADKDGDNRCDVNVDLWQSETWTSLNFQMNDQHYFRYAYASSGEGATAKFTVSAYADLDCDGEFSTFERYGYADETAPSGECSMKGSSAFFKEKETE